MWWRTPSDGDRALTLGTRVRFAPRLSAGAPAPGVGATLSHPLPAPQATLISALAKGVIGGDVPWNLIGIGALLGLVIIAIYRRFRVR